MMPHDPSNPFDGDWHKRVFSIHLHTIAPHATLHYEVPLMQDFFQRRGTEQLRLLEAQFVDEQEAQRILSNLVLRMFMSLLIPVAFCAGIFLLSSK